MNALVLSGGTALGIAHIGIWEQLEQSKNTFDVITGTSMGAIVGVCIASGMSSADMKNILEEMSWLQLLSKPAKGALMDGKNILKYLQSIFGDKKIEELPVSFACVATNINTGEEVVIDSGKIVDALRSTTSIPAVFEPYFYKKQYLVDGCLINNLPILLAEEMGAKKILAVNVVPRKDRKTMYTKWKEETSPSLLDQLAGHVRNPGILIFNDFLEKSYAILDAQIVERQKKVQKDTMLFYKHLDIQGISIRSFLKWRDIIEYGKNMSLNDFIDF